MSNCVTEEYLYIFNTNVKNQKPKLIWVLDFNFVTKEQLETNIGIADIDLLWRFVTHFTEY